MIFILLCILLGLSKKVTSQTHEYDLDTALEHFEIFIHKFNKEYKDEIEKQMRFEIFKESLREANEKNSKHESAPYGINQFSDIAIEEFGNNYTGCVIPSDLEFEEIDLLDIETAENIDYRPFMGPAKDQRHCTSCWAFATVGSVEYQYYKRYTTRMQFSEQQLLDCTGNGCQMGQSITVAARYTVQAGGLATEQDYPYYGVAGQCRFHPSQARVRLTSYKAVALNEQSAIQLLNEYGPLTIALYAEPIKPLQAFGGIFNDCHPGRQNHAVVLVGYGTENGVPYWIIRNSWGESWGDQGYLKINRQGGNPCSMFDGGAILHTVM